MSDVHTFRHPSVPLWKDFSLVAVPTFVIQNGACDSGCHSIHMHFGKMNVSILQLKGKASAKNLLFRSHSINLIDLGDCDLCTSKSS